MTDEERDRQLPWFLRSCSSHKCAKALRGEIPMSDLTEAEQELVKSWIAKFPVL
jgi:hypothetical protein